MKKFALAAALALVASAAMADGPQIALPAGAQLLPMPEGCGIIGIVVLADGNQQAVEADGTLRAIAGNEFQCLMEMAAKAAD